MFSIVETVLLRPLPYPDPNQLISVSEVNEATGAGASASYPDFLDWQEQSAKFCRLSAHEAKIFDLTGRSEPRQLAGDFVSPNFFEVLGVGAELGRTLAAASIPNEVVLSHRVFARDFAGDPRIVGTLCRLDGEAYRIAGVMPARFDYPKDADVWVSTTSTRADIQEETRVRGSRGFTVLGRLNPRVELNQAQTEMHVIAQRLASKYPDDRDQSVNVASFHREIVRNVRPSLLMLIGSVAFVLLIACANLGNLMLARSSTRQREMAIRASLGAGRLGIITQTLTESLLLSLAGGFIGVLLAWWSLKTVIALAPADLPRIESVRMNFTVLGFSAAISVLCGLLFGLLPAWQVSCRGNLNLLLLESGRVLTRRSSLRSVLVITEIALSVMLLSGAGLLVKSLVLTERIDPGFRTDHLLTVQVYRPVSAVATGEAEGVAWSNFFQHLTRNIETVPGVESAGATLRLPLQGRQWISGFEVGGRGKADGFDADVRIVSNDYLQTLRIPLLQGRYFATTDTGKSQHVAVINETAAQRAFHQDDPLGKVVSTGSFSAGPCRIIGVVGNTYQTTFQQKPAPEVYYPYTQVSMPWQTIVVRTKSDPLGMLPAVRREVAKLDPNQSLGRVETMDHLLEGSLSQPRFRTALLGSFAALAFLLAIIGIYAVITQSVSSRTREIGIRMALGASTSNARTLVLHEALVLILTGIALGVAGALGLSRLLVNMLYGTSATDPLVFSVVTVVLGLTGLLASYLPARRAANVDPMVALRYE